MPYPYDADDLAAIARLASTYNGNAYDAGTNPGGMAAGGHRTNFIPALEDLALVVEAVAEAADAADVDATAAAASEAASALNVAKLTGTSTTSLAIATGSKSFTTQASKFFNVGSYVIAKSDANPTTNLMAGQVTAYSGTSLTVNVTRIVGSGTYADWTIIVSAQPGETGATGATGARGPSPAIQWNFSTGTADSDPGNGLFKFDSATFSAVTFAYFDNVDTNGTSITAWLDALDDSTTTTDRGRLYMVQPGDPTKFAIFKITGAVTDGTGYRKVPVSPVVASSASVPFTNAELVAIDFSPTGNKGTDGGGAGDVVGPSGAGDNKIPLFDTTTGKLIKDSGYGIGTSGSNLGCLDTANTYSGAQSYAETVDIQQQLKLSGDITPTQIAANTNDYAPTGIATASVLRLSTDASRDLTGITTGADGRILVIVNVGSFDIVLKNDATSTAANRFLLGGDYTLPAGQAITLIYDSTAVRWRPLGNIGLGGDGSATRPAWSFSADVDCGVYRIGANNIAIAVNGAKVLDIGTAGLGVTGVVELGHASDTTISRPAAGRLQVEGEELISTKNLSATLTEAQQDVVRATVGVTGRNKSINGALAYDQRNAGGSQVFTAAAAIAYCVDRFYGSCTGANVTGQQISVADSGFAKGYRFTGAASVTGILFGQRHESFNCSEFVSKEVVFSVYTRNSVLTSVTWTAYYANSADTFSSKTQIATGTFTVTSSLARYQATFNAGANAANGITIELTVGAQTSGTWDITGYQFERGTVASPFDHIQHPLTVSYCQRYHYKSWLYGTVAPSTSAGSIRMYCATTTNYLSITVSLPTQQRNNSQTIVVYDDAGASGKVYKGANGKNSSVLGQSENTVTIGTLDATSASELGFHFSSTNEL